MLLVIMILALVACQSTQPPRTGETLARIQDELQTAKAQQTKNNLAAIEAAMLPKTDLSSESQLPNSSKTPRFDLAVNDAPASQVFSALVSGSDYSMLIPPEITGRISLNLKNVTIREALEAIQELYGYDFKVRGKRIYAQANALQTRVFQINYLATSRKGSSELAISSGSLTQSTANALSGSGSNSSGQANSQSPASRVQTNSDVDFWSNLEAALNALLAKSAAGDGASQTTGIVVNKMSGVVVVKAMPKEMRMIENYLRVTQTVVERQVMLEAKIMEVQLSEGHQAGVNWGAFRSGGNSALGVGVVGGNTTLRPLDANGGAQNLVNAAGTLLPGVAGSMITGAGSGLIGLAFQTANFASLLTFLESQGGVEVLSSPRIATLNNQKAVLKVGTDETYITGFTVSASTTTGTNTSNTNAVPTPTTSTLFSGISLDVMPQIDQDGYIVLHVHPAVSKVTETTKAFNLGTAGNVTLPLASRSVNETDSIVRVKNGHIVAIGGLMSQDQSADRSGLPGTTGSAYGQIVGQRSRSMAKRELVILLKPTVIGSPSSWDADLEATGERFSEMKMIQNPENER